MTNLKEKMLAVKNLLAFLYINDSKLGKVIGKKDMFKIVTVSMQKVSIVTPNQITIVFMKKTKKS